MPLHKDRLCGEMPRLALALINYYAIGNSEKHEGVSNEVPTQQI
jgi:hypothetical protein